MMLRKLLPLGLLLVPACATIPPVTAEYRLAETTVQFRVTRIIGCSAGKELIVADTIAPIVTHRGGTSDNDKKQLHLQDFSALWANGDIKFEVHPDGRLKSVNSTATGQAQPILDAAIKFATGTGGFKASIVESGCGAIHGAFGDKTASVTLSTAPITVPAQSSGSIALGNVPLVAETTSKPVYEKYKQFFGSLCLTTENDPKRYAPLGNPVVGGHIGLDARQPALVDFSIREEKSGQCEGAPVWSGSIAIAQAGTPYKIPVPRPPWFGKQTFAVVFDEAGALSTLQYAQESGAAAGFTSALAGYEAGHTTNAERTAALKAETDLIAAQQKLVKCQADPASC